MHADQEPPRQPARLSLLERMPRGGTCAEIGVYRGDFSAWILRVTEPTRLHLIDPWNFEPDAVYETSLYGRRRGISQGHLDAIHQDVLARFARQIAAGTVRVHRAASETACADFPDHYFDWIYIDGNHLYEFVKQDLERYLPKVKVGGFITGDDYGSPGWWDNGVQKAVDEFAASGRCEPPVIENSQFCLRIR